MCVGGETAIIMFDLNVVAETSLVIRVGLAFIRIGSDRHHPGLDRKNGGPCR